MGDSPADYLNGNSNNSPLVVRTVEIVQSPTISSSRHQNYKHSKAIHSSRSYLTSMALELDKIYPIVRGENLSGKEKPLTFGTILGNAKNQNPDPHPQFRDRFKKLKENFTADEWAILEALHQAVNGHLHLPLDPGESVKNLILPSDFSGLDKIYKRIAVKSNVVSEESHLIVKNEGSVSGGSPDSDKTF